MTIVKGSNNKCRGGCAETGSPIHTVGGNENYTTTMESSKDMPQKLKIELHIILYVTVFGH
jgi:hypothetical protein